MGYASVNYIYKPSNCKDLLSSIQKYGAIEFQQDMVLHDANYWIDLRIQEEEASTLLFIRIALCNPDAVLERFIHLLEYLFSTLGGGLYDLQTQKRYTNDLTEENIEEIIKAYHRRKAEFVVAYGDWAVAVSEPEFFRLRREQDNPGSE